MSKIGKKPINIPSGVDVTVSGGFISVKGPKGTMKKPLPLKVSVVVNDKVLNVSPDSSDREGRMAWGLARALVQNIITGVAEGFEKVLEFQGVGYKATIKGNDLELGLGFSHPILIKGPEGITFKTEKNSIRIQGMDKELIGKVAAEIRSHREPEPYKGSGIRYAGEHVRRKAGKKAATAA
ncbi:MAG: 50S ribosomal protein L6 [Candidatus Yanofskybacteria bacterium RIFCSPLOWO2_02_FULL_47_9b]|uniref:Large ribosomal subunit protein uL6 n=1 Tax=Candidatus Yanofskybacteria bacterium RIFCSPLOWO2_02_FULL_47_9b TaxID=1802708 RepID=A0A1F8H700_9BACT|nr:MAG: 50S ribosomal protein L6 [Candidatus Yanofskybacteria bacterium RIFCSPLOWO2_02_FULL_47_9b]